MNSGYIAGIQLLSKVTNDNFERIMFETAEGDYYNVEATGAYEVIYDAVATEKPLFISFNFKSEVLGINAKLTSPCQTLVGIADGVVFIRITTQMCPNPDDVITVSAEIHSNTPNIITYGIIK